MGILHQWVDEAGRESCSSLLGLYYIHQLLKPSMKYLPVLEGYKIGFRPLSSLHLFIPHTSSSMPKDKIPPHHHLRPLSRSYLVPLETSTCLQIRFAVESFDKSRKQNTPNQMRHDTVASSQAFDLSRVSFALAFDSLL